MNKYNIKDTVLPSLIIMMVLLLSFIFFYVNSAYSQTDRKGFVQVPVEEVYLKCKSTIFGDYFREAKVLHRYGVLPLTGIDVILDSVFIDTATKKIILIGSVVNNIGSIWPMDEAHIYWGTFKDDKLDVVDIFTTPAYHEKDKKLGAFNIEVNGGENKTLYFTKEGYILVVFDISKLW